jgi:hypothetical protein
MTEPTSRRGAKGVFAPALEAILEEIGEARHLGRTPIVIFDLDDTLFSTRNRHLRILMEFAAQAKPEDAADAKVLAGLRPDQLKYSVTATALQAGVRDEALLARLRDFWFERFFRNEYLTEDAPVAGAPEFVRAALFARATVVYLTGRDEGMRPGTMAALEKWDFPLPHRMPWKDRVRLMMKPVFDMEDLGYKVESVAKLSGEGDVVAVFENEPAYLNAMLEGVPGMKPVLLETQNSGRAAVPHHSVLAVPHFLLR